MLVMVLGLVLFFAIHLVPSNVELRNGLIARFGEGGYKAVFAALSLVGLTLIVLGFYKLQLHPGKNPILWEPPIWTRHLALALMLPAMIALVATYVPSHIHVMLKHPMLVAIKIWALAHLLANGDLASLVLFGGFLAFAVYDRISVKRRGDLGPLGKGAGPWINDVIVVVVGTALYAAIALYLHEFVIGVPPLV
ncbi:MAG: NnrU family protein [Hyphomicrobium sp.]|uniref:NnrU family protein n=1 Tax=Hyphomicrobium sp. TaxID=82 RepID=UPI001326CE9D|nr:NnrU family protein [Hyphomicrobium sp.]KAB2940650.1 MAG: NnrU family protein [Hyphomicrobium sp.]MBZ0211027.1 NnrU family protein [Hyphomicrobium sp.]MCZ7594864.1 NnrU family protein [Hyphomicrobium sp.]